MNKILILCAGSALLSLGACSKASGSSVTADAAAAKAAACAGWSKGVIKSMGKLNYEHSDGGSAAPYFNFPEGKTITVSPNGSCARTIPTAVISATPMHQFGQHVIVMTPKGDHVWILIFMNEENGARTFTVMDGTPEENLPFDPPTPADLQNAATPKDTI